MKKQAPSPQVMLQRLLKTAELLKQGQPLSKPTEQPQITVPAHKEEQ